MVALGIAGGSLVLVLCANGASLRRSAEARVQERLLAAGEAKLAEWLAGAERSSEGLLPGFDHHRWEIRVAGETDVPVRGLSRVHFRIVEASGKPILEWRLLRHASEAPR